MNYLHKLQRFIRIVLYKRSVDKKLLDFYVSKLRNLEPLSDSEVTKFKTLAEREKEIYG